MNRKFPSQLKIGGHVIKIEQCVLKDLNGESDFAKNTIRISKELPRSQQEATLVHEIIHFLNTSIDERDYGHALLDSLSEQLYQVLKDNDLLKL